MGLLGLCGLRLPDGKFLIVATMDAPKAAITDYAARSGIEPLFSIFKSRGFCLESTHLTDGERLSKLVALLTLALGWAHLMGQWIVERIPINIKKHGPKAKSVFRTRCDHLRRILLNLESHRADYR